MCVCVCVCVCVCLCVCVLGGGGGGSENLILEFMDSMSENCVPKCSCSIAEDQFKSVRTTFLKLFKTVYRENISKSFKCVVAAFRKKLSVNVYRVQQIRRFFRSV